jgi:hypothetical protein
MLPLQQFVPLKDKINRDKTIQILIENHYLKEIKVDKKTMLLVNPAIVN